MKFWPICFGLFLCTAEVQANEINCQLNGYYPRMNIQWNEETVTVKVENPKGFASMPQFEAPLAFDAIPFMQTQSESLKGLGDSFSYRWERKQCSFSSTDEWLVSCVGKTKSLGDDNGVPALHFTTARIEESSLSGKQSTLRLRFIMGEKNMYFVAMPFPMPFCSLKAAHAIK